MKVKLKFLILWNLKLSKRKRRDLPKKKLVKKGKRLAFQNKDYHRQFYNISYE